MTSAHSERVPVRVRVPAKVNLELNVGPARPDGFHALSTVYQAVSLYDDVTVVDAEQDGVSVSGPFAGLVPTSEDNLALKAVRAFRQHVGRSACPPVHVSIAKAIPVAGGMAGGSADAAATLVALDALLATDFTRDELAALAADLGSDVPFLLFGGTAVGSGRGEVVTPVLARGTFHWVFALAEAGLSTPAVFAELDALRARMVVPDPIPGAELMAALRTGDPYLLAPQLTNDLEVATCSLRPELGDILRAGMELGALTGIISGSGPTIAFLTEGPEAGIDLAVALTASGTVREVRRATGPVHGAHVIPVRVD